MYFLPPGAQLGSHSEPLVLPAGTRERNHFEILQSVLSFITRTALKRNYLARAHHSPSSSQNSRNQFLPHSFPCALHHSVLSIIPTVTSLFFLIASCSPRLHSCSLPSPVCTLRSSLGDLYKI